MSELRAKILDTGREEYRIWKAKKEDLDPNRIRGAVILCCEICNIPIGPDALIFEVFSARSCLACAKKAAAALKEAEAIGLGTTEGHK